MNIFDEYEHAQYLLEHGFSKFMYAPEILILAKYFRYLGQNEKQIEQSIYEFCERFEPEYNETLHAQKIHSKVLYSSKYGLRRFTPIPITKNEIEKIKSVKNYRYEKLLFVALALAKYYKMTNSSKKESVSNEYYLKEKMSKLMSLAHISEKKGENILGKLYDLGMMNYNKVFGSYHVMFAKSNDSSEVAFEITNMSNLIEYYPPYCKVCGERLDKRANKHEMHNDCSIEYRLEYKRNHEKNRYFKSLDK